MKVLNIIFIAITVGVIAIDFINTMKRYKSGMKELKRRTYSSNLRQMSREQRNKETIILNNSLANIGTILLGAWIKLVFFTVLIFLYAIS